MTIIPRKGSWYRRLVIAIGAMIASTAAYAAVFQIGNLVLTLSPKAGSKDIIVVPAKSTSQYVSPFSMTKAAPVVESTIAATLDGLASVASNFAAASELEPSWGTGAIPGTGRPDVVGAFRFMCNAGHLAVADPIVYPGQPGKGHLHQFFGNTLADANSTYKSLRTSGQSSCMSPLNRSAYWTPAMMNGRGKVVRPDYVSIYYKRMPKTDPNCQRQGIACVNLPRGLRYVFGHSMDDPSKSHWWAGYFNCDGPTATPGRYPDIVTAAKFCPAGNRLGAIIDSPSCWDGKNLDSPDHRSHMSYPGYGWWGYLKCDDAHPYIVPNFTMGAWYTTDADLDHSGEWTPQTSTWHLSSDKMDGMPMMKPGSTFHADWFGAWDDEVMKMWHDNCIDKLLSCSGGDLGNGKQMKMFNGFSWNASPRLVDPPK